MNKNNIIDRLQEEIFKLDIPYKAVAQLVGCSTDTVCGWLSGKTTPTAVYLANMHRAGFDVIYILTGERRV